MTAPDTRRQALALLWVGIVAPLVITAVAVILQITWLPRLPEPAATHWGGTGGPDSFGSAVVFPVSTALVGLVMPALSLAALYAVRRGGASFVTRLLGAISLGMAGMMGITMTGSVAVQRDLADAMDAPSVTGVVVAAMVALAVLGVAGYFLQPAAPVAARLREATPGAPLSLGPDERAAWVGGASTNPWLWAVVLVPLGTAIALGVLAGGADNPTWVPWLFGGIGLLVVVALVMFTSFTVAADERGLTIRSTAGWPRLHAALDDIDEVGVVDVEPLGDFGGWGLRQVPGATAVVTRRGPGLQVVRTSGRRLVVTVDDPETGAALLTALVARARS